MTVTVRVAHEGGDIPVAVERRARQAVGDVEGAALVERLAVIRDGEAALVYVWGEVELRIVEVGQDVPSFGVAAPYAGVGHAV